MHDVLRSIERLAPFGVRPELETRRTICHAAALEFGR
jgi:hypothetical protein